MYYKTNIFICQFFYKKQNICIILACLENNVEYTSSTSHQLNSETSGNEDLKDSAKDCQELCRQTNGCAIFMWTPNTKYCQLLKGANGRILKQGKVSGPPVCKGIYLLLVGVNRYLCKNNKIQVILE